ncbi:MAG: YebC/PmpR family DNA-binding transcriptional regulator [bacterium]
MSGHSRWAGIKHKKAVIDKKRGKIFTKIIREITIAAKAGGGNADHNPRLRAAIDSAKAVNMPSDNIKKAIQRGTGELPGVVFEELQYEGYGPGGVAVMCDVTTDNKNRTASEIRRLFSTNNGSMGENGCVSWMFKQKGNITILKKDAQEDKLMSLVLDAGAEDMQTDEDVYEIVTDPVDFEKIKEMIIKSNISIESSEITMLPQTYISLSGKEAEQMIRLMEALEDSDDIRNVYANFEIAPDELPI